MWQKPEDVKRKRVPSRRAPVHRDPLSWRAETPRDGVEQEDSGRDFWSFEGQEVSGAFVAVGTVFAGGVVPELVGGGFGEEVGFRRKDLGIEQFGFDGVVDAFDVGIGIGAGGRVETVLGAEALLDGEVETLGPGK